jgi:GxxExxY protein
MVNEDYLLSSLTEKITGSAYKIHNRLGQGFQKKVYENALVEELKATG